MAGRAVVSPPWPNLPGLPLFRLSLNFGVSTREEATSIGLGETVKASPLAPKREIFPMGERPFSTQSQYFLPNSHVLIAKMRNFSISVGKDHRDGWRNGLEPPSSPLMDDEIDGKCFEQPDSSMYFRGLWTESFLPNLECTRFSLAGLPGNAKKKYQVCDTFSLTW